MPDNLPYPCLTFSVNSSTIFEDNPVRAVLIPSTIYQLLFTWRITGVYKVSSGVLLFRMAVANGLILKYFLCDCCTVIEEC